MNAKTQLYEVEIKSKAILKEGQKGFITYFRGGTPKTIVKNVKKLYPQFTKEEDRAIVEITPISEEEYKKRLEGGAIYQKKEIRIAVDNEVDKK